MLRSSLAPARVRSIKRLIAGPIGPLSSIRVARRWATGAVSLPRLAIGPARSSPIESQCAIARNLIA